MMQHITVWSSCLCRETREPERAKCQLTNPKHHHSTEVPAAHGSWVCGIKQGKVQYASTRPEVTSDKEQTPQ